MKKLIGLIIIFFLFVFTTTSIFALPKTIRFATEATYPPFEYVDASGQIKGFDIALASALCAQMKVECTFSNQAFNSLIPSLNLGKFDAIIAALNATAEREKQVSFTQSYYEPSASFVAASTQKETLAELPGKIVGVQQGTTFEKYLTEKYRDQIKIKTYASIQEAFLDLVAKRVDLVLTDTPIAIAWLQENARNKQFHFVGQPIVDPVYFGTGYGIAVRKQDPELLTALNSALTAIKKNGTYTALTKQYFGS